MQKWLVMPKKKLQVENSNWLQIPNYPYLILIIWGSTSGETNALLNLINQKLNTDNIYLCDKDLYEAKYQFLINKNKGVGLKPCNDSKAFIEYSNDTNYIYKSIEGYNPN